MIRFASPFAKFARHRDWQQYTIYVTGKDLKLIKSDFFWGAEANGAPVTLYLSDIKWE